MIRELIEEIEIEKLAEAYIDQLALELANEWLEKDAGVGDKILARLGSSRAAMNEAAGAVAREGAQAGSHALPNPAGYGKRVIKGVLRATGKGRAVGANPAPGGFKAVIG